MNDFRRKQVLIAALSLPAFVVVALVLFQAKSLFGFVTLPADDPTARLVFVVRWLFCRRARFFSAFSSPRDVVSTLT